MKRIGEITDAVRLLQMVEHHEVLGTRIEDDELAPFAELLGRMEDWELIRVAAGDRGPIELTREGCEAITLLGNPETVESAIRHCVDRGVDADLHLVICVIRHVVFGEMIKMVQLVTPKPSGDV